MRQINAEQISNVVARLLIKANYEQSPDISCALQKACDREDNPLAKSIIEMLKQNAEIAVTDQTPLCQDTGMAVVFVEVGQDVHIIGDLTDAINEGVRRGAKDGYLRCSVVSDPVLRTNTGDNTPAVIHYSICPGDKIKIHVAPKGFGSENMSALKMLKPSDGIEGVKAFVVETVKMAGSNPCPPIVVGVGMGGTMEKAALLSKKALLRPVGEHHENEFWRDVEHDLLKEINSLGIGPGGFGGMATALWVSVLTYPTHIAGLPVAVNISCHATRHTYEEI